MSQSNHAEIIAAYVAGTRPVSADELRRALQSARADLPYRSALAGFVGGGMEFTECDRTLSRLAELAHLSARDMERRFPTFAAHLEACPACRREYWELKPCWTATAAASLNRLAAGSRQRLVEGLRLLVTEARSIVELGLAPPGNLFQPVASTASAAPPASHSRSHMDATQTPVSSGATAPLRIEWRLRDETSGAVVWVSSLPRIDGRDGATIEAGLEGLAPAAVASARYRLLRQPQSTTLVTGTLASLAASPVDLSPGTYLLVLEVSLPSPMGWEIPIELLTANSGAT